MQENLPVHKIIAKSITGESSKDDELLHVDRLVSGQLQLSVVLYFFVEHILII